MNKHLSIILSSILIVACGGGGGGGGEGPTTPTTPAPTVNLSAEPTSVLLENTSTLTWSSSYANTCSADWTTQTGTSGAEAVIISTAGNNSFSISCTGDGGSRSASVTVEGYREADGVVVDGYISGAEVFIDEDDDWVLDSNENSTTSDNEGKFTIRYANGNLVSIGGTDLDSQTLLDNLLITHKLTGHSDFKAVTPVTSIAAFMGDASLVNEALGIDASIDVFTFDPVANKGDGGINDYLYEKGNQLTVLAFALQNITNNLNTAMDTTQDYFKAITEEIEKDYTETETKVDIETEAFVTKVLDNVIAAKSITIDETAKSNTAKALAGVMPVIEVKAEDELTTAVIRFAISTLQRDIQTVANGTASAETLTSYTEDILNYIADDQSIDASKITPEITAIADSVTIQEDTDVEINVILNDSYVTTASVSVIAGNGNNGSTSVSNNLITYSPGADYNGTDTFSYTITQGDKTSSANVTVTIEAVNDKPSIDVASTIRVDENQTAVTTVSVSDVDEDELTLTLGGADADSFDLSSDNVLTFKEAPDYETKDSYSITLTLTDGTETVVKDITITIIDINDVAPVFTSDATFSAAENQTAIGTVTATDLEGDELNFTISGTELAISSEGVLTFVSVPDYETKTSYTATVTASDGINKATQEIIINITNINDNTPSFISDINFSAEENQSSIGFVNAVDADGDEIIYAMTGEDSSQLNIDTSSGLLSFKNNPNYETKSSYKISITISDGKYGATKEFLINVVDVNDSPIIGLSSKNINENNTIISNVNASDEDGDTLSYSLSGGDDVNLFLISAGGDLSFASPQDYEDPSDKNNDNSYEVEVTVTDSSLITKKTIEITVLNINDNKPIVTSDSSYNVDENKLIVGSITASDLDGSSINFSSISNDISVNNETGAITFKEAPDYETKTQYTAVINVSDEDFEVEESIVISINNLNDNAPVFTNPVTTATIDENDGRVPPSQTPSKLIMTVSASDADGDEYTFSIPSSSNLYSKVKVGTNTGEVQCFSDTCDYEEYNSISGLINVSDGFFITQQEITINLNNINDNSPILTINCIDDYYDDACAIFENSGTSLATYSIEDADGDLNTFSTTIIGTSSAPDSDLVEVDQSTKLVNLKSEPDFETARFVNNNLFKWDIRTSDGENNSSLKIVNSYVLNKNEYAATISGLTQTKKERSNEAGFVSFGDLDEKSTIKACLKGGDADEFQIQQAGSDGCYTKGANERDNDFDILTYGMVLDYERKSQYQFQIELTDSTSHDSKVNVSTFDYVLNVEDVNDPPVITSSDTFTIDENTTTVGTITATDQENDNLTYSLYGSDANLFEINSITGVLTFREAPDYETRNDYNALGVLVSDGTDNTTASLRVKIADVDETETIQVTVAPNNNGSGNVYVVNGVQKANISLQRSKQYNFIHPSGHPLRFSESSDGTHSGGSEYTTGVTKTSGSTIISFNSSSPSNLYYYCSLHSNMGGSITIN